MKKLNLFKALAMGCCVLLIGATSTSLYGSNSNVTIQNSQSENTCKGIITDINGEPVIGVSVIIKGTKIGTMSDMNGGFVLKGVKKGDILAITCIGYESQNIKFTGQKELNIILKDDKKLLNEVVVVGYGSQRRRDLTGAVSSIKSDAFKNQPITTTSGALQGRVAGVSISNSSGAPGGDIKIRVRGANSINNDNAPLIVLDNIPMGSLRLQDINPYDIASIDVLKDASATAVYGSRGANGVIIITTKKGDTSVLSVNFQANLGYQMPISKFDLMNGAEYAKYANLLSHDSKPFKEGYENYNTNWQDLIFNDQRFTQNYQLSFTGGTKAARYFVSTFFMNQPGTLRNSGQKKGGLRSNIDFSVSDDFTIGVNAYVEYSETKNTGDNGYKGNPVMAGLTWNPTAPIYLNNNKKEDYLRHTLSPIFPNPYMILNERFSENFRTSGFLSVKGTYYITSDLKFETTASVDGFFSRNGEKSNDYINPGDLRASQNFRQNITLQNTNILTYNLKKDKHDFSAIAVFEMLRHSNINFKASGSNLSSINYGYYNLGLAKTQGVSSDYIASSLMSYMGRLTYNYDDKYLVTATIRRDGSSKFQSKNKWGTFPSFSFGWNASNEGFMKPLKDKINLLKVRAGWGGTGSQNIDAYSTLALLGSGNYSFGTPNAVLSYFPSNPINKDLRWETTYQTNLGVDLAFLDNNLTFSLDYYNKDTKDLLLKSKLKNFNGGGTFQSNLGKVNNHGVEMVLGYNYSNNNGFSWNTNFNVAYNKNTVISIGKDKNGKEKTQEFRERKDNKLLEGEIQIIKVGKPLGSFYVIPWEGIYQQDDAVLGFKAGDNKYRDVNKNNSIGLDDRVVMGSAMPKVTLGFENTFTYKNFEFSFLIQGAYGHKIFNAVYMITAKPTSDVAYPTLKSVLNYWTPNNKGSKWANPESTTGKYFGASSQFLQDASYTRLKNLTIGYTLPKRLTKNYRVKFFASAQNLFTLTNYKGFDPENTSSPSNSDSDAGIDMGAYPSAKAFIFGINISFNK